jgi:hypothetical protein
MVVVIGQFFARLDIPDCPNNDSSLHLIRFAVRIATMVDKCGDTVSINHVFAVH